MLHSSFLGPVKLLKIRKAALLGFSKSFGSQTLPRASILGKARGALSVLPESSPEAFQEVCHGGAAAAMHAH
eukprot:8010469-Pyramimonas_sp.AAC.1